MSKGLKITAIVLVVLVIAGAVYIKYIKPKMDAKKELKRLNEANLISTAARKTSTDSEIVATIVASQTPELVGIGGSVVKPE